MCTTFTGCMLEEFNKNSNDGASRGGNLGSFS